MKNIYCIVGPSGSGKTTLANVLSEKYGYKVIESYTTRPPRYEGEKGHIFVSSEEFAELKNKYACNTYDGYEYGITADLINENDLYVVEPSGVEDLIARYRGEKGIKVFGLNPGVEVLVERMQERGDSDEKIIRRLSADAEIFQGLDKLTSICFSASHLPDELCDTVHSWIEDYECASQHEFSLVNEHGKEIDSKCCNSLEDALVGIRKAYPDGLPEGWTVKDKTTAKRDAYKKAIKQVNPKLKLSEIYIDPSLTSFSYKGDIAVPFKYGNKQYVYHENYGSGDTFIREDIRFAPNKSASEILAGQISFLYNKTEKIDRDLALEYADGETEWAAQLEVKLERIENAIPFLEKALEYLNQKSVNSSLVSKIQSAEARSKSGFDNSQIENQISL